MNAMLFDESMKNYSVVVLELNNPFGKEQYSLKKAMMQDLMSTVGKTDQNYFHSTQKSEPLDSYYIFQKQKQFKFDFNPKYLEQIPQNFRKESVEIFYEFHNIFTQTMRLAATALGMDTNLFVSNERLLFNILII